jgi:hypothetical protein
MPGENIETKCGLNFMDCSQSNCTAMGGKFLDGCMNKVKMTPEKFAEFMELQQGIMAALSGNGK